VEVEGPGPAYELGIVAGRIALPLRVRAVDQGGWRARGSIPAPVGRPSRCQDPPALYCECQSAALYCHRGCQFVESKAAVDGRMLLQQYAIAPVSLQRIPNNCRPSHPQETLQAPIGWYREDFGAFMSNEALSSVRQALALDYVRRTTHQMKERNDG
jgi:hypothetical protein